MLKQAKQAVIGAVKAQSVWDKEYVLVVGEGTKTPFRVLPRYP